MYVVIDTAIIRFNIGSNNLKKYESVAIPALCSGNNEYPVAVSTLSIVDAISAFLETNGKQTSIRNIYLCDINRDAVDAFVKNLKKYFALVYNRP
jgi:O-acetyl-ADP-ribose deacetylase (regulator of RNase III)